MRKHLHAGSAELPLCPPKYVFTQCDVSAAVNLLDLWTQAPEAEGGAQKQPPQHPAPFLPTIRNNLSSIESAATPAAVALPSGAEPCGAEASDEELLEVPTL